MSETKLKYQAVNDNLVSNSLARQAIINGNFDVWQRGTSSTNPATSSFLPDRFVVYHSADGGTFPTVVQSRQAMTPGEVDNAFYFNRFNVDGAGSSLGTNAYYVFQQYIENGTRYLCGNGKKVTVSFWAKSDIAGKQIALALEQRYGTGGSPSSIETITGEEYNLTSTWTKYTHTFTTNTLSGKTFGTNNNDLLNLDFELAYGATRASTIGASGAEDFGGSGNIDIAQVQLCAGDVALPFMPKSFEEELRACQRYYEKSYGYNVVPATATTLVGIETKVVPNNTVVISQQYGKVNFKITKRSTPTTVTIYPYTTPANTGRISANSGSDLAASSGQTFAVGDSGFGVYNNSGGSLTTSEQTVIFHWAAEAEL